MSRARFKNLLEKIPVTSHTFMIVLAALTGLLGGFGAVGFRSLIAFFQHLFWKVSEYTLNTIGELPWYTKLIVPAAGGIIVGHIVYFFAREAKGHGVPEVMEAVALNNGRIRPRVVVVKSIASAVCIGSGGSVGREGPIVQIGSALGSTVGQWLNLSGTHLRNLVGCGAAAGIAATFNAPVAGALFSAEVILGSFGVGQFSTVVVSSVVATVVSRSLLGNEIAFTVPFYQLVSYWELIPYTILGLLAGVMGVVFIKTLYATEDVFEKIPLPEYLKPLSGGILIGLIGIWFPNIFGVGYSTIDIALTGGYGIGALALLFMLKMISTPITIGSGGSGGVFAPSLFLGSMLGGIVGSVCSYLFPGSVASSGAYALVGMGAVVSATTHAPLTAIVMIFELTGNYHIILPLMISCVLGSVVAGRIKEESIYTMKLVRRGVRIKSGYETNLFRTIRVREVMRREMETVDEDMPFEKLLSKVLRSKHLNFFVTDKDGRLRSVIFARDLRPYVYDSKRASGIRARDLAHELKFWVTGEDSLDVALKAFEREDINELPVVDSVKSRKIIGTIWQRDMAAAYNELVLKQNMAQGVELGIKFTDTTERIDLADGASMIEIEIPARFIGRTIKDIGKLYEHNLRIVFIKKIKPSGEIKTVLPKASYRFESGDRILVIGERDDIERWRAQMR